MKILLFGEYSGFHNSLKKGLQALGHEVTIIGNGDGFKKFPADIFIKPTFTKNNKFLNKIKNAIYKLTKIDLASIELYYKFKRIMPLIKEYDAVQLINSIVLLGSPKVETKILQHIFKFNKNVYLHGGSMEYIWVDFMLNKHNGFSSFTPLKHNPKLKKKYQYALKYLQPKFISHFNFVYKNIKGIIPSDVDYKIVYDNYPKGEKMIPAPICLENLKFNPLKIKGCIIIFCGINTNNQYAKGIPYFLDALKIIENKYPKIVTIKITRNLPYNEYLKVYNEAHILLDQCLSYDQGYNGREAMARGKVVLSGANEDFKKYYNLTEETMPLIEAKPDVDYLVLKLSELIENPNKIEEISIRARKFIEKHHDCVSIAKKYIDAWGLAKSLIS